MDETTSTSLPTEWRHPQTIRLKVPPPLAILPPVPDGYFCEAMRPRLLELDYAHISLRSDELEGDIHRLSQRMKQIAFGKNTPGYQVYAKAMHHGDRQFGNANHPVTPRLNYKCPKRSWDNLVGQWRRALHLWDANPLLDDMFVEGLPLLHEMLLEEAPDVPETTQTKKQPSPLPSPAGTFTFLAINLPREVSPDIRIPHRHHLTPTRFFSNKESTPIPARTWGVTPGERSPCGISALNQELNYQPMPPAPRRLVFNQNE